MITVLEDLALTTPAFSAASTTDAPCKDIDPVGVSRYITSIVSSPLDWIDDEDVRENIWNLASLRLSERSGRSAMTSLTRTFQISEQLVITLHEPSLTGDTLGFKTWSSSFLLARLLPTLKERVAVHARILELGAGTGLLGLSAACIWQSEVLLTDLADVVPNLQTNLVLNEATVKSQGGHTSCRALDWSDQCDRPSIDTERFPTVIVADPVYSPDHPQMLVETILNWLAQTTDARVVIALPLRDLYKQERIRVRELLDQSNLVVVDEGEVSGFDDWYTKEGEQEEVTCSWSIWRWKQEPSIND
jgi:predicted nicotinamide N-methyase